MEGISQGIWRYSPMLCEIRLYTQAITNLSETIEYFCRYCPDCYINDACRIKGGWICINPIIDMALQAIVRCAPKKNRNHKRKINNVPEL